MKRYPNGHDLAPADVARHIRCDGPMAGKPCDAPAKHCKSAGVSSFYFCEVCWETPGPYGVSPRERAMGVPATGPAPAPEPIRASERFTKRDFRALARLLPELREASATPGSPYTMPLDAADLRALRKAASLVVDMAGARAR